MQPFRLVLVGMRGWGVDDWMAELQADGALQQDVMVLNQLSDADLAALYRQCAFTVYPSWAEGWGLPVVESLAHGRLCLASNTSSLPEAGAGWAEHLPPGDEAAWLARLADLMADPGQLQALNARIAKGFTPPAWHDTARVVHQIARRTPARAPAKAPGLSTNPSA
jgi:glycosyltransferase involved in cell wall biosynthesis